jgi:hypothetical protein
VRTETASDTFDLLTGKRRAVLSGCGWVAVAVAQVAVAVAVAEWLWLWQCG